MTSHPLPSAVCLGGLDALAIQPEWLVTNVYMLLVALAVVVSQLPGVPLAVGVR